MSPFGIPITKAVKSVVAVHGLGGHYRNTWTAENGKLWLRDFLPLQLQTIEIEARILSYGYNSTTAFSKAVTDINDEAEMLLNRIWGERSTDEEKARPIFFVAHSLGGILVKKAMIIAHERSDIYGGILDRIHGVAFFGTPHRGSDLAWWADFSANLLKALELGRGTNTTYVEGLKRNSKTFSHISQQWIERAKALDIRTYYETERMHGLLVVDKDSARLNLPNEIPVGIAGANHRTICKFENENSQKYKQIWNALKIIAATIRETALAASKTDDSA
ncbi:hypothetical protein K491DRAFT_610366 [Lophiostoma macrostomum CBS 122681]|uniref:DUF676 domain-containing protein n=1 Tax=Lophiostoma macrostomum CBS 122681 TaxID=1314788 RepID=A0A6A6SRP5_9PLEO|nr:hypothetical protein K491DRAFT_610366 [Lophiostoma macrostomum CBS 122681]